MEILEINAIEKWAIKGNWLDYKKVLKAKFSDKYPSHEIVIKQSKGCGGSGKGIIDYIVYGTKKH